MRLFKLAILLLITLNIQGQSYNVDQIIVDGDTIPLVHLPTLKCAVNVPSKDFMKSREYRKLKRDVKKVYPYARLAAEKLEYYNAQLEDVDKNRKRKRVMKEVEKAIKEEFGDELKKLTVTQGKILLKLIDRETGESSYELVKELRGGFSAMFWQTMAKFVGSDLKMEYDPQGEDRHIEHIVTLINAGRL